MADAVTSQIIEDGPRTAIMYFTNVSDGSGEAAVAKVDVSALSADPASKGACTSVNIESIQYTNTAAASGKTGDILFTTTGASNGDTYSVVLMLKKNYG